MHTWVYTRLHTQSHNSADCIIPSQIATHSYGILEDRYTETGHVSYLPEINIVHWRYLSTRPHYIHILYAGQV